MSDTTTVTPPPQPTTKTRRTPGQISHAQAAALDRAEQICLTALKPAYGALAGREIGMDYVNELLADILAARNKLAGGVAGTADKENATQAEADAEKKLIIALQEAQSAAKQKYGRSQPALLLAYHVGARLDQSRASLEQVSADVINKLQTDTLPGFNVTKVKNLAAVREAYIQSQGAQSGAQSGATGARRELDDMVQSIADRRIGLLHAVDAEWPYHVETNAGIRREFGLPLSRPFNG